MHVFGLVEEAEALKTKPAQIQGDVLCTLHKKTSGNQRTRNLVNDVWWSRTNHSTTMLPKITALAALLRIRTRPRIRSFTGSPRTYVWDWQRPTVFHLSPSTVTNCTLSPVTPDRPNIHSATVSLRLDSDLKAFGHSFASLAPQPGTYTKCL